MVSITAGKGVKLSAGNFGVGVGVREGVGVLLGVGVRLKVGVTVALAVAVGVGLGVSDGRRVAVSVGVGLAGAVSLGAGVSVGGRVGVKVAISPAHRPLSPQAATVKQIAMLAKRIPTRLQAAFFTRGLRLIFDRLSGLTRI
jgi:UDP-3-O-[3-hydroxymyristoyl] glucosamine N-acyltransferase